MGLGRKFFIWAGSATWDSGKFLPNPTIFLFWVKKNLIGSGQKIPGSRASRPFIYYESKVCSCRVRAHLWSILCLENSVAEKSKNGPWPKPKNPSLTYIFLTRPDEIFWPWREKVKNLGFVGEIFQTQRWLTLPCPALVKKFDQYSSLEKSVRSFIKLTYCLNGFRDQLISHLFPFEVLTNSIEKQKQIYHHSITSDTRSVIKEGWFFINSRVF